MIPCIETSCLKYPACKHKRTIACDDLAMWMKAESLREIRLGDLFPNLVTVEGDKIEFCAYIAESYEDAVNRLYLMNVKGATK